MRPPRRQFGAKQPSKASSRASAIMFLLNARSIEGVTAEGLARQYRLKLGEAEALLVSARERRANG